MTFRRVSDTEAELHQPPTPTFKLESTTRFTLREPDMIDFLFKFKATQHVFKRGYLGLFWANYIRARTTRAYTFGAKKDPDGGDADGGGAFARLDRFALPALRRVG